MFKYKKGLASLRSAFLLIGKSQHKMKKLPLVGLVVFLFPRSQIASQFYQYITNTKIKQACFFLVDTLNSFHSLLLGHKKNRNFRCGFFFFGCLTWIRTKTNCTKNSCATVTPSGNPYAIL